MDEILASRPFSMFFGNPATQVVAGQAAAGKWRPATFNPLIIGFFTITMLAVAIAIEVTLALSNRLQGFPVDPKVAYNFGSIQFIKSFLPTALIAPFALIWAMQDQWIRLLQPYVELSKGNSPAHRSLLVDYVSIGKFRAFQQGLSNGHWIIFLSATVGILNLALQPLAGSILILRTLPRTNNDWSNVTSTKSLGLDPNFADLSAFTAAAGFAEAAVFHNLTDPPFVKDNFTVAEFQFPTKLTNNGTLLVNTTGIQTTLNCFLPDANSITSTPSPASANGSFLTVQAKWSGCTVSTNVNTTASLSSINQYGVTSASPCVPPNSSYVSTSQNLGPSFVPIMFWFWNPSGTSNGTTETKVVFCAPTIRVYEVQATSNLTTNALDRVTVVSPVVAANNVTGSGSNGGFGLNGGAFNGVLFNTSTNPFVQARATATTIGVPGAIFRYAIQAFGGVTQAFQDPGDGWLRSTEKVYTQHLSIIAKSIYFVSDKVVTPSLTVENETRLWVDANSAHALAVLLFFTAMLTTIIYIAHHRARRNLHLVQQPGSLAFAAGIAAGNSWGSTLNARDSKEVTEAKLSGLRFGLDEAGRIVEVGGSRGRRSMSGEAGEKGSGRDVVLPLLDRDRDRPIEITSPTSSSGGGAYEPYSGSGSGSVKMPVPSPYVEKEGVGGSAPHSA